MKAFATLGTTLALISPALAAGPTVCPINEAVSRLESHYIAARGQAADKVIPLLHEQEALVDQANYPNMPIGAQLRSDQMARFNEINQEVLASRAKEAALSGYVRDVRAIVKMSDIALGVRRGFKYPENSPDHFYEQYVLGLTGLANNQGDLEPTGTTDGECSIDSGLYLLQHLEIDHTDQEKIKAALEHMLAVANRYHIDTAKSKYIEGSGPDWIPKIPVISDQQQARRDAITVHDGLRGLSYIEVMQELRGLQRAALSQYWGYVNDVDHLPAGGKLETTFGQTWSRQVANGDLRLKFYDTILQQVAAAIPSETMVEAQQGAAAAKNSQ
jgi:hypothetical protein